MKQPRVEPVLRDPAVGAAVTIRENRLSAMFIADSRQPRRHEFEGFLPAHAAKFAGPFGTRTDRGEQNAIGPIHEFGESAALFRRYNPRSPS